MSAVAFDEHQHADVVEVDVPTPAADEALVAITSAGICGSDVTALAGVHPFRRPPLVTGHEGGGRVVAVGADLEQSWVGRHVALEPQRACGECETCRLGLPHLCRNRLMLGMAQWSGTLAGHVVAPPSCLHPVDDRVDPTLLALAEPLAVAQHAVRRASSLQGARAAVLGGGAIGALVVHLLATQGADHVLATDPRPHSRELCTELGAHEVRTGDDLDDLAGSFDVVLVAAAIDRLVDDAVRLLAPRGTVVQVGLFGHPLTVDVAALQQDEKTLTGSNVYDTDDFAAAVEVLQRDAAVLSRMADPPIGLRAAAAHLEAKVRGEQDTSTKVLVDPTLEEDR